MPQLEFKVTGATKWLAGIVEDHSATQQALTFNSGTATADVAGGGLAWVSIYAWGQAGASLSAEIFKAGKPLVTKRNYIIDPDNSLARAIQFDPDKV